MDYEILRDPDIIGKLPNIPDNGALTSKPSLSPHFTVLGTAQNHLIFFPPPIANHIMLYFKQVELVYRRPP